jgi:hypothetical protein
MAESRLPENIRGVVYADGINLGHLPGSDEHPCEGAKHHSPRPLFTESTWLVRKSWFADTTLLHAPDAWLCGTCRDNLTLLLILLYASDGKVDWPVRREFGNEIRALAQTGWAWFTEHRPKESP